MPARPRSRLHLLGGLVWAAFLGASALGAAPLRIALGIPVVLLPGILTMDVLDLRPRPLERWALVVGLSLGWTIAVVIVTSFIPGGISSQSTVVGLGVVTALLALGAVVTVQLRPLAVTADRTVLLDLQGAVRPWMPRGRRMIMAWSVAGVVVIGSSVAGIWLSVVTAQAASVEEFTQLSLVRQGDTDAYLLTVESYERADVTYRLELAVPGAGTTERTITLAPFQSYRQDVTTRVRGDVVATLRGGSETPLGYRRVSAAIS